MTFKHINFDDSPVMRSLERMAISKEPKKEIEKTASSNKPDFTPTGDFFSNLTKLCSGLRDAGLSKYADELENNYLRYKQAETAYETSKETGEDLVDQAHPQGSVRVGDSEYGEIETIVDQQLRTLKIIDKNPTGKLASATDIIGAVKLSLGNSPGVPEDINNMSEELKIGWRKYVAYQTVSNIYNQLHTIKTKVNYYFSDNSYVVNSVNNSLNKIDNLFSKMDDENISLKELNPVVDNLKSIIDAVRLFDFSDVFAPTIPTLDPFGAAKDIYKNISNLRSIQRGQQAVKERDAIESNANTAISIVRSSINILMGNNDKALVSYINARADNERAAKKRENKEKSDKDKKKKESGLQGTIKSLITKLNSWKRIVNLYEDPDDISRGLGFIDSKISALTAISNDIRETPDDELEYIRDNFNSRIQKQVNEMGSFYNDWIKP